jgi:hypothetical protein
VKEIEIIVVVNGGPLDPTVAKFVAICRKAICTIRRGRPSGWLSRT